MAMNLEPTVFIVDDDPTVRESLRWLVESVGLTAETYETAQRFHDSYDPVRPGCLVLDIRMPEMSGLDLQQQLAGQPVSLPVIIITGHGDISAAVRAMKNGAVDFLEKPFSDHLILERIQQAIERDVSNRRKLAEDAATTARLVLLTPREREVMDLVVAGAPNKAIAVRLGISQKTVEIHRARVMKKTGVESLADLVRLAEAARQTQG